MASSPVIEFGYWPPRKHRSLPSHRNAGLEIVLLVRGQLTWQVEGKVEPVVPGSVFFTLPWETHGSVQQHEPGCELYYVVLRLGRHRLVDRNDFSFVPALGFTPAATARLRRSLLSAPRRTWPATTRLAAILPEMIDELRRSDRSDEAVASLARLVVIELVRSLQSDRPNLPQTQAIQRVRQFVARLPGECHRPWTLSAMANTCHLGRTRFSQILMSLTGDSPRMVINRARVDRAQKLLLTTNWPITRIALECGFSSSQYFAGVFRAYSGSTARSFRTDRETSE